jgi:RND family efflux transporter MFP subunit
VAPIDGYVSESRARAGDTIERGAVLGMIDDTDLRLERRKWVARAAQLNKEYRAALAVRDRSEANILRARLEEAKAELDLVEEKLTRTQLLAPFDGVVAEGDLSRSLGSPVERGEVLFQVAPLDRYRIVLEVDETDIDEIEAGQVGTLKLTSQPGEDLTLIVERVVPVAVSEDGRNFFRVEARLDMPNASLRPGMEGVGKVSVGPRGLLWIYTHSMVDWLRLGLWAWFP